MLLSAQLKCVMHHFKTCASYLKICVLYEKGQHCHKVDFEKNARIWIRIKNINFFVFDGFVNYNPSTFTWDSPELAKHMLNCINTTLNSWKRDTLRITHFILATSRTSFSRLAARSCSKIILYEWLVFLKMNKWTNSTFFAKVAFAFCVDARLFPLWC